MGYQQSVLPALLLLLATSSCLSNALNLPKYMKPCSRSDPKLNECALQHSKEAITELVKGDNKYHIPSMLPLVIPQIVIDANKDLTVRLRDVHIQGLEDTEAQDVKLDLDKQEIEIVVSIPRVNLNANYDIKGRILVLPIVGQGPANITFVNGIFTYKCDFTVVNKNGKDFIKIAKNKLYYDTKRAYFRLDNLFGGDGRLSDQMNQIIDDNWKEVLKDIGPAVAEAVSAIITAIFSGVMDRVSYEDLFLP